MRTEEEETRGETNLAIKNSKQSKSKSKLQFNNFPPSPFLRLSFLSFASMTKYSRKNNSHKSPLTEPSTSQNFVSIVGYCEAVAAFSDET
jgi:hypothetical protein